MKVMNREPSIFEAYVELGQKIERLGKEADWLAQQASKEKCPPDTESVECDNDDPPRDCAACWREAAREAVGSP